MGVIFMDNKTNAITPVLPVKTNSLQKLNIQVRKALIYRWIERKISLSY